MKIIAKICIAFDCAECGTRCETESDYIWIDETRIFRCDFCGAASRVELVPTVKNEADE